ncbi:DNA polymerase I [Verrucomicrobiaceae bacterium N1E253]|uniref:DNA polymerase I n=1 Tax=Oceaniferula marina TaxID=2748318 RepID=A0A851GH26_9BACT|nr:DNA polymerase I [Oceaniferula marina]NWK56833.1 DNA polymerase I [Oceaniferula marina]
MHKLFLLDGMALVYRAHFALIRNPILTSKGINTSAVFGFTNTLLDLIDNQGASHIGVAFDTKEPTPRHEIFPEYKAQRDAMPEELAAAIPYVKQLCRALGIPVLEVPGYEADDIIGTLAHRADEAGNIHTYMVTPDKDFAQLVTETTTMWKPGRQGGNHELLDVAAINQQWEIESPKQVIDILGLWGDASDNIPGVPGIGEKTAKKLIKQFGSMENILDSTDQLKGKQKENLENFREQALLSKKLVTIMLDAPVDVHWNDLALGNRDDAKVKSLLTELEFNAIGKRLYGADFTAGRGHQTNESSTDDTDSEPTEAPQLKTIDDVPHQYHLVDSVQALDSLTKKLSIANRYCFDLETTSLDPRSCDILGIAFSVKAHEGYYVHTGPGSPLKLVMVLEKLKLVFQTKLEKIGHNLKFDLSVLAMHGCEVSGPFYDTMLVHSLVYPDRRHNMDFVSEAMLGYTPVKLEQLAEQCKEPEKDLFASEEEPKPKKKKGKKKELNMSLIPVEALAEYAAEDADVTLQIAEKLRPWLEKIEQEAIYQNIEAPLIPVLTAMENEGIALDIVALKAIGDSLGKRITGLTEDITEAAGKAFNLNSPKQLGEILFGEMQLVEKPKKTKTGQFKTDEQTLAALAPKHPIVADILEYREASKLKSTYVDALPNHVSQRTNRVHTHFHQLLASTGRLASSDPNLQNIPVRSEAGREIRKAFVPRDAKHTLLAADYSQVELRVMAALSGDESMIQAIKNDLDIHSATAAKVFDVEIDQVSSEQRRSAKMVNFGIIYGISAFGLSQRLGIARTEASEIIETYFKQYPGIKDYMESTVEFAVDHGYIETITGRKCYIRNIDSRNGMLRKGAERAAINAPVQGSAADMIKLAMIQVSELLDKEQAKSKMLLQVHDELLFDLDLSEKDRLVPQIIHTMEHALPLPFDIPCKVDIGTGNNWLQAH